MVRLREFGTYIKLENFSGGPVIDLQTQDKDLLLFSYRNLMGIDRGQV